MNNSKTLRDVLTFLLIIPLTLTPIKKIFSKNGVVSGKVSDKKIFYNTERTSVSGEGLYVVNFEEQNNLTKIVNSNNIILEEGFYEFVLGSSNGKDNVIVKKEFNNYNPIIEKLENNGTKRFEKRLSLSTLEESINDIYVGNSGKTYISTKDFRGDYSHIHVISKNGSERFKIDFWTGIKGVVDFEVEENENNGIEKIIMLLSNNTIRVLTPKDDGKKGYEWDKIIDLKSITNERVTSVASVGSYYLFGTEKGSLYVVKKDNAKEYYSIDLKDNVGSVKEIKINKIKYNKKTEKTSVEATITTDYGTTSIHFNI